MYELIKSKIFRPRQPWEKNLLVLWFGTFMAGIGFSLVMPFMPLYINTLGTFTHQQLNFWSGITFSSTFLVTTIVSPWWGRLADRKGRKLMLLRASLGMAIVISLMGAVTSVYQLIGLRLLQGVFSGYISNATALVATGTPKEKKRSSAWYFSHWFCYRHVAWSSFGRCHCVYFRLSANLFHYWYDFITRFCFESRLCP